MVRLPLCEKPCYGPATITRTAWTIGWWSSWYPLPKASCMYPKCSVWTAVSVWSSGTSNLRRHIRLATQTTWPGARDRSWAPDFNFLTLFGGLVFGRVPGAGEAHRTGENNSLCTAWFLANVPYRAPESLSEGGSFWDVFQVCERMIVSPASVETSIGRLCRVPRLWLLAGIVRSCLFGKENNRYESRAP